MAELLIYVPGIPDTEQSAEEVLKLAGLGQLIGTADVPGKLPLCRPVASGPDGRGGAVLGWVDPDLQGIHRVHAGNFVGYFAGTQEWKQQGEFWLGREHGHRCKPGALWRAADFPSSPVPLDDGQEWQVPLVRHLPSEYHYAGGEATLAMREAFMPYLATGERVHELFTALAAGEEIENPLTLSERWGFAADVLALNYALTRDLIEYLGLLRRDQTVIFVLATAIEWWTGEELAAANADPNASTVSAPA